MRYFKREEFKCKCGCERNKIMTHFLKQLDVSRHLAGIPFVITSGYRCPIYNKAVGGRDESAHVGGFAADISTPDARSKFKILHALITSQFVRIGVYPEFIHVDCDLSKDQEVLWHG